MLSIQEIGSQILGNNPKSFYAICGAEYGIKKVYIQHLAEYYGQLKEVQTVNEIIDTMSRKHIIPLTPCLYVVRYDDSFVSGLNEAVADKVKRCKIIGTVVAIYDDVKQCNKLSKYLPDNTACIDAVSPQFLHKYLIRDYSRLGDRLVDWIIEFAVDYNQADNMCYCLNLLPDTSLFSLSKENVSQLFGHSSQSTEKQIQIGTAARSFKYLMKIVDDYEGDYDTILYTMLQTMIELDKLMDNPKTQSDLREYVKVWTREDVYYMFMHIYNTIIKLRSAGSTDGYRLVIQLITLLQFRPILTTEVIE